MTPSDLHLIRSTFDSVRVAPVPFRASFRRRAVALDPSLAALLPAEGREQADRLVETIAIVLDGLDAAGCAQAKEQAFALRHRWTGIQPRHYGTIGQALLEALADRLGQGFTEAARKAWADAFVLLAEALMARSYNPLGLVA